MSKDSNDNTSIMRMNFRSPLRPNHPEWKPLDELRQKEPEPDIKHCRCCTCRDLGKVSSKK